jgi:hypothetical protein
MPYSFAVTRKSNYLHITVRGENTRQNVSRYLQEIVQACIQYGCSRVLVEEDLAGPSLAISDVFFIASEGSRNASPTVNCIAYVDVNPEHDPFTLEFAENVAVNRGVNMKRFATVGDAEDWISRE